MKKIIFRISLFTFLFTGVMFSCQDLDELNINPNGVDPANGHPNLLIATVMSELGKTVVDLGYGDIAGVMQHTQKDGWSGGHNNYEWFSGGQSWGGYYSILRTNEEMMNLAEEMELDFHKGVGLILKSYTFGLIADLWGDAPYTSALNGEQGGEANLKPTYDSQRDIYMGILADLETANTLLSGSQDSYSDIIPNQDVYFAGDVESWQRLANSLALRYYMRISNKEAAMAQAGIERIAGDQATYPIILNPSEDATLVYPGAATYDAWPNNTVFDPSTTSGFNRIKLCSTLIDALQALNDPRIDVYAARIVTPIEVDSAAADDFDQIIDGTRIIAVNIAEEYETTWGEPLDLDPNHVGLPPSSPAGAAYNLNPDLAQGTLNPHCSQLNDMYKETAGPMLKARIMAASEVNLILAEAALKGWSVGGSAQDYYEAGVHASMTTWGLSGQYDSYIAGAAAYNGTLEQLIEQKWIASWTAAAEAWFDYRRTGFPDLQAGPAAIRQAIPLRFYYMLEEIQLNPTNVEAAIDGLEPTSFAAPDPDNSAWSRTWLLQGTGLPY